MLRRCVLVVVILLALAGCTLPQIPFPGGGPVAPVPIPSDAADQPTPSLDPDARSFRRTAHPVFVRTFADPLYYEQGNEFAPFGSDEGSDTLWVWTERKAELGTCRTVRWMIEQEDPAGTLMHPERNGPDVDGFVIGTGSR